MANNDSTITFLQKEIDYLKTEVSSLKKDQFKQCLVQTEDKAQLKELIISAVSEAVEKSQTKINVEIEKIKEERSSLEKRVENLEQKDGKMAMKVLVLIVTTIITTTVGWVVLGYLNNQNAIAASNSVIASEVENNGKTSQEVDNKN